MPWTCGYDGECYEADQGKFSERAECQQQCQAVANKELHYELHSWDLTTAFELAPIDQVAVVRRLTGVTVSEEIVLKVLRLLDELEYHKLAVLAPALIPWIRIQHPFALSFVFVRGELSGEQAAIMDYDGNAGPEFHMDLIVRLGIPLALLQSGDSVFYNFGLVEDMVGELDMPTATVVWLGDRFSTELDDYELLEYYFSHFNILEFPRIDYFRYVIWGNEVQLTLAQLGPITETRKIGPSQWVVRYGEKYRLYTSDAIALLKVPVDEVITLKYSVPTVDIIDPPWTFYDQSTPV